MTISGIDPRIISEPSIDNVLPSVGKDTKQLSITLIAIAMLVSGILLFNALETNRKRALVPIIKAPDTIAKDMTQKYNDLYIPPVENHLVEENIIPDWILPDNKTEKDIKTESKPISSVVQPVYQSFIPLSQPIPQPPIIQAPNYYNPVYTQPSQPQAQTYQRNPSDKSLIFDRFANSNSQTTQNNNENIPSKDVPIAEATTLRNKSTIVTQGTLIPAVLETALDSNRAGQIRALVTRDLRGFDGKLILIPRGSQLIGEYQADMTQNQKRALVLWTRLIRPDGVSISLISPASDALGSIGIAGNINTHFFERFGSAIFRSTLEAGVGLATRRNNTAIIISPNSVGQTINTNSTQNIPTLKVKQGAIISVMVARDLDFSSVTVVK